jgi:nucleoside phosphorylase
MNNDREIISYRPKEDARRPADEACQPGPRWNPTPPRDRWDFKIAIICALPLEASAVSALFDKQWEYDQTYGRAPGDLNFYSIGVIGYHNVVLVHMPNMGKVAAATATAGLRASFRGIQIALVVGICGGAPSRKQPSEDILLGDVVISEGLVQYDLGRQLPNNRFVRKDTPRDNLPRPGPEIRAALAKLQDKLRTEQGRRWLGDKTSEYFTSCDRS